MKKLVLLSAMFAGIWLTSCQKENSELTPVEEVELADLQGTVSGAAARYAMSADSVTIGKCKGKLTEIATADLAASITDYIKETYPDSDVKYAAKDEVGKVIVAVTLVDGVVVGLLFNADGTFKQELKQHMRKAKLTKVEVSALPGAITAYITENYSTGEIKQAGTNVDGEFFIGILDADQIKILLFNADGNFVKELERPLKRHRKH